MILVLAAVAGCAAVRRERSLPTTMPTEGWKTFTDNSGNLRFRSPPDWRVERLEQKVLSLVPPELVDVPERRRDLSVFVDAGPRFWIGEDWFGTTSQGRLPDGQAYLRSTSDPAGGEHRVTSWSVDWGRPCLGDDRAASPTASVSASLRSTSGAGTATPRPSRRWWAPWSSCARPPVHRRACPAGLPSRPVAAGLAGGVRRAKGRPGNRHPGRRPVPRRPSLPPPPHRPHGRRGRGRPAPAGRGQPGQRDPLRPTCRTMGCTG